MAIGKRPLDGGFEFYADNGDSGWIAIFDDNGYRVIPIGYWTEGPDSSDWAIGPFHTEADAIAAAETTPRSMEVIKNRLIFNGTSILREDYYIYIPDDQAPPRKLRLGGIDYKRTGDSENGWSICGSICEAEFSKAGQWLETISIKSKITSSKDTEPDIRYRRYTATNDPDAEKLTDCRLIFNLLTNDGEVAGVYGYREKIYARKIQDGRPVERLNLPYWTVSNYLRELVVEEGISHLCMDFNCNTLEKVEIPDSVHLAQPPNGIENTAWFQNQPDGDIYFCGYYCGTKGPASKPALRLKEGTIGIISNAYGGIGLESVVLPASICYIGENVFHRNKKLGNVELPAAIWDLKDSFKHLPRCNVVISGKYLPVRKTSEQITPRALYNLGRTCDAARQVIEAGYEPIAPRLTYDNGWIAHYYYSAEGTSEISFHLALQIPSGQPVEKDRYDSFIRDTHVCWSKNRTPAHYYWSEAYLNCCVELIQKGVPSKAELNQLEHKWIRTHPDRLSNSLHDVLRQNPVRHVACVNSLPEKKKWKKIHIGKGGVQIDRE